MLPDLSPTHILIFVVLALLVIGPKDLPMFLRKVGQFVARLRGMANEFRASFDEMARQSELDELRREVDAMRAAATHPVTSTAAEIDRYMSHPAMDVSSAPLVEEQSDVAAAAIAEAEATGAAPLEAPRPAAQAPKIKDKPPAAKKAAGSKPASPKAPKPASKSAKAKPGGSQTSPPKKAKPRSAPAGADQ
jgi:sec-independent protein translocase protein TatB